MLLDALLHSPFEAASAPVAQPSKPPPADASSEAEQPLKCIAETRAFTMPFTSLI